MPTIVNENLKHYFILAIFAIIFAIFVRYFYEALNLFCFIFSFLDYIALYYAMAFMIALSIFVKLVLYFSFNLLEIVFSVLVVLFLFINFPSLKIDEKKARLAINRSHYEYLIRENSQKGLSFFVLDILVKSGFMNQWNLVTVFDEKEEILLPNEKRSPQWKREASFLIESSQTCSVNITNLGNHIFNVEQDC